MPMITIVDESTLEKQRAWGLEILEEVMSLDELIRRRIYQEVTEYNVQLAGKFYGLVQPTTAERPLSGYSPKASAKLDWQAQYEKAIAAFTKRGYLVLIDDKQVTDLHEKIALHAGSSITFLKLVPLVGG
jgi:hypothetical protein